jgi:hypothetical protein
MSLSGEHCTLPHVHNVHLVHHVHPVHRERVKSQMGAAPSRIAKSLISKNNFSVAA